MRLTLVVALVLAAGCGASPGHAARCTGTAPFERDLTGRDNGLSLQLVPCSRLDVKPAKCAVTSSHPDILRPDQAGVTAIGRGSARLTVTCPGRRVWTVRVAVGSTSD